MSQTTCKIDVSLELNLEQIKKIILSLSLDQQNEIISAITNSRENLNIKAIQNSDKTPQKLMEENLETSHDNSNMIAVFERISQNAEARGLTEEILEELLADES